MNVMVLGWIAVALAFALPLAIGVPLQGWLEARDDRYERLVPVLYLAVPMAIAFLVAFILRARF